MYKSNEIIELEIVEEIKMTGKKYLLFIRVMRYGKDVYY